MAPHQERIVTEKQELDEKISKLGLFTTSGVFESLEDEEKDRLERQLSIMDDYSAVLGERIAAFPVAQTESENDGTGGVPPTGGSGGPH